jgi:hypothetical protein
LVYPSIGVPTISGISQMMDSNTFQAWEPQRWDLTGRLDTKRVYYLSGNNPILQGTTAEAREEYFGTLSLLTFSGSTGYTGRAKIWWDVEFEFIGFNPAGFVLPDRMTGKRRTFLYTRLLGYATGDLDLVVSSSKTKGTDPGDEPEPVEPKKSLPKVKAKPDQLGTLKLVDGVLRLG